MLFFLLFLCDEVLIGRVEDSLALGVVGLCCHRSRKTRFDHLPIRVHLPIEGRVASEGIYFVVVLRYRLLIELTFVRVIAYIELRDFAVLTRRLPCQFFVFVRVVVHVAPDDVN